MTNRSLIAAEIAEEPGAIRATVRDSRAAARAAADALRGRGLRRLFVLGNGTSYHSSLAVELVHRRHARPDEPTLVAMTAGEFRHYPPELDEHDALLGISASGEFRDVVGIAETYRGRLPLVAIVHVPESSLTRLADHVVISAGGPSAVPVMTKTFASTLTASLLLVAELFGDERGERLVDDLLIAADAAEEGIRRTGDTVAGLADELRDAEHLFVVGSGGGHVAALEGALKLKETALVHAEGSESWATASGAATLIGPAATVIALESPGPGRDAVIDVARHCAEWGARVIEVAPTPAVDGASLLETAATANEELAALDSTPSVALLADALARARGLDPDHPGWTERYRSQGLTHVIGSGAAE
jgi:glucosamine--fructose-6-phosphate aminotransferase (isomerizing)